jgi:ribonuclease J
MASTTFYGGVKEIGGNKILLETENGTILLDFGRRMGYAGNYYSEFIQPRTKNALRDLLKLGVLPPINGIYPQDLLDTTKLITNPETIKQIPINQAPDYWKNTKIQPYNKDKTQVDAILLSHAHFDHIQDISFLDPAIPIHTTPETRTIAKAMSDVSISGADDQYYELRRKQTIEPKPESYKTLFPRELEYTETKEDPKPVITEPKCGYDFTREYTPKIRSYITEPEGTIKGIKYKLIPVDHSIPGACSILLTLPDGKRLLYTGDLRFHGSTGTTVDDYVKAVAAPVDILIIEGTRIENTATLYETMVQQHITEDIKKATGLVLINFGWKDLSRFRVVYESATIANHRTLVISPKLAYLLFEMHTNFPKKYPDPRALPYLQVYLKREDSLLFSKADYSKWKMGYLDHHGRNTAKSDQNLVRVFEALRCGGANYWNSTPQPEPGAPPELLETYELATHHLNHGVKAYEIRENPGDYVLMFSDLDVNELFDLIPDDASAPRATYIAASTEPFNDEMEIDESKFMNWLTKFNVSYEYEVDEKGQRHFLRRHVSGHASQPELVELIRKLKPGLLIPVHSNKPDLFQQLLPEQNILLPEYGAKYTL